MIFAFCEVTFGQIGKLQKQPNRYDTCSGPLLLSRLEVEPAQQSVPDQKDKNGPDQLRRSREERERLRRTIYETTKLCSVDPVL